MQFPDHDTVLHWLDAFPEYASRGVTFADFSIIQQCAEQRAAFPNYSVWIWTLDQTDLGAYGPPTEP